MSFFILCCELWLQVKVVNSESNINLDTIFSVINELIENLKMMTKSFPLCMFPVLFIELKLDSVVVNFIFIGISME